MRISHRYVLWRVVLLLCLVAFVIPQVPAQRKPASPRRQQPNILFILADDLGREWFSSYGSQGHQTPNIDRLAATGIRFENAYATPLCTPTRYEMLTGRYPFRTGWTTHHDTPRWGGQNFDPGREVSFARILKSAGYATAIAGKWQVNDLRNDPDLLKKHGFDEHCMWAGAEADSPRSTGRYYDPLVQINGARPPMPDRFGPDVFSDYIVDFMRRHKNKPFLAYYPMVLTHQPYTTTPHNKDTKLQDKALFPGMVDYVDYQVGRLISALDDLGLRDNTVVIFTTDNGSPAGVSCRAWGREVRGGKAKLTEAGVHLPFIVSLPGRIPSGRVTDELIDFSDVLPTLAELAGAQLPQWVAIDGRSFAGLLLNKADARPPREWIFTQYGETRVIRDKQYKLYSTGAFYDLKADPFEEHDVAESASAEAKMTKIKLDRILKSFPTNAVLPFADASNGRKAARGEEESEEQPEGRAKRKNPNKEQ